MYPRNTLGLNGPMKMHLEQARLKPPSAVSETEPEKILLVFILLPFHTFGHTGSSRMPLAPGIIALDFFAQRYHQGQGNRQP